MSKKNKLDIDVSLNKETLSKLQTELQGIKAQLQELADGGDIYNTQNNSIIQLTQSIEIYNSALNKLDENNVTWTLAEKLTYLGEATEIAGAGMDTLKSSGEVVEGIFGKNSQAAQAFNGALAAATQVQNMYTLARNASNLADKVGSVNVGQLSSSLLNTAKSVATGTSSLGKFRGALIGTGIGAIVVLIGFLIEHFDSLKNGISNILDKLGPFGKLIKTTIGFIQEAIENIGQFFGMVPSDAEQEADRLNEINYLYFLNLRYGNSLTTMWRIIQLRPNLLQTFS